MHVHVVGCVAVDGRAGDLLELVDGRVARVEVDDHTRLTVAVAIAELVRIRTGFARR